VIAATPVPWSSLTGIDAFSRSLTIREYIILDAVVYVTATN